jgi:hypothetical protein
MHFSIDGTDTGGWITSYVLSPTLRFHIDYSGNFGINTSAASGKPINTATTAYLSSGGIWTNASSRELKENIKELSSEKAMEALPGLTRLLSTIRQIQRRSKLTSLPRTFLTLSRQGQERTKSHGHRGGADEGGTREKPGHREPAAIS